MIQPSAKLKHTGYRIRLLPLIGLGFMVPAGVSAELSFDRDIKPFLEKYCVDCHGAEKQKAKFAVHEITEGDLGHWEKIAENVSLDLMPPPEEAQPTLEQRDAFVDWIKAHLKSKGIVPNPEATSSQGNRVRHDDLFSGEHKGPAFSYSRLWRISQPIYDSISREMHATRNPAGLKDGPVPALVGTDGENFRDYDLLRADDAVVRALMLNFRKLAQTVVRGEYKPGRWNDKTKEMGAPTFDQRRAKLNRLELLKSESPGPETYDQAVVETFKLLLGREPRNEEHDRYKQFLAHSIEMSDPPNGCENMVKAVLMSPEFIFRMELGEGKDMGDGRRMLGPRELAHAIAFTLTDSQPDNELVKAVEEGRLNKREDVEREVRRMLAAVDDRRNWNYDPWQAVWAWKPQHNPRIPRFFQEFFGYTKGEFVFKDKARNGAHLPLTYIRDANYLVHGYP